MNLQVSRNIRYCFLFTRCQCPGRIIECLHCLCSPVSLYVLCSLCNLCKSMVVYLHYDDHKLSLPLGPASKAQRRGFQASRRKWAGGKASIEAGRFYYKEKVPSPSWSCQIRKKWSEVNRSTQKIALKSSQPDVFFSISSKFLPWLWVKRSEVRSPKYQLGKSKTFPEPNIPGGECNDKQQQNYSRP